MDANELGEDRIRIENKIYDSKKLAEMHPGGPLFIKAFSGRDASQAFISYHRRLFPHSRVEKALDRVDESVKYCNDDHKDFVELCEKVDKVLPRMKSFAPWHYYLKVAFILTGAIGLELFMHYNKAYTWYWSALLGFFYALIGLNIQHDANHGAISRRPWVNRLLGMSQNWIGGSAINWIHQHVVQHHIHTNDVHLDPDLAGSVYLRLNPLQPLMKYQMVQHIYFFILLAMYGFVVVYQSLANVINGSHHTPMSALVKKHRIFEVFTSCFFAFRWILIPILRTNFNFTILVNTIPMYIVGGYYLAFFFSLSHNFKGVHVLEDTRRPSNNIDGSFLYKQVISSSNVGGAFLCFMNGGLNYQIEHHLFPRISHTHYPKIAPVVREFCQERNIPYIHFPTVADNLKSCTEHLWDMGSHENPKTINFKTSSRLLF